MLCRQLQQQAAQCEDNKTNNGKTIENWKSVDRDEPINGIIMSPLSNS